MSTPRAAILGFHAVEEGPGPLCVPPRVFQRQVAALAGAGAVAFTVSELTDRLWAGTLPERAVAFTFDDGYQSVHRHALPTLAAFGYPATVFPVTGQLGGTNAWDAGAGRHPLRVLGRGELAELAASGWEVGGHTHTHRALPGLRPSEVVDELAASKRLEDLLGTAVSSFAYPYGAWDEVSRRLAGAAHPACLGIGAALVTPTSSADLLERVDAWYLRRAWQLTRLHGASGQAYLALRRAGRSVGLLVRRQA